MQPAAAPAAPASSLLSANALPSQSFTMYESKFGFDDEVQLDSSLSRSMYEEFARAPGEGSHLNDSQDSARPITPRQQRMNRLNSITSTMV